MAVIGEPINVYALVEQWRFSVSAENISGTRVYIGSDVEIPDAELTTLPKIGDEWDADYDYVTLKTIDVSYVGDNDNCPKKYICNYDGRPYEQTMVPRSLDDLPVYVDISGEYISWMPPSHTYSWQSDLKECVQPLYKHVALANFRLYRIVKDFDTYMALCMAYTNRLNATEFKGFPAEMVQFNGVNMYEFRNRLGKKRWRAELNFACRAVTKVVGDALDGWNFILREDKGMWDKPINQDDGSSLYETVDFDELFETDPLGDEENFFQAFPDN